MDWGEVIFFLLTLAGLFVLVLIVFILKSEKQAKNKKDSQKRDESGGQD